MLEAYEQITKLKNTIERFSSFIINTSSEKDMNEILLMTIDSCLELTGSDGATIYLKETIDQEEKLVIRATKNLSVNFEFYLGYSLPISPISLCGYAAVHQKPVVINDTLNLPENHEFRQFKFFDKSLHYVTINTITAPIFDFSNNLLGVLQVINKKAKPNIKLDETNATLFTISYTETDVKLILAISSFVGTLLDRAKAYEKFEVSITNTQKMLANMFDSVKKSISVLNDILISGQQKFIESLQTKKKEKILLLKEGIELFKKQYQLSKITETIISIAYLITRNIDTKMIDILHEVISTEIRLYDIPLKINESEYVIFLHNVDIIKARMIAKRIERKVFEKLKINEMLSTSLKFLWSFYELKPDEEKNIEEVLSYLQKIAKENEGEIT
ncbi:GAF domain protein [Caldicellulosiruptor obsidiansis OB47]|uniref:GAF domain protein n=1 Tax=Caldicellulosiruptor obsidiansis (strain ATCC BAA-2073 / JCM 16842 / OB47) TaxID=608506 RepID=D9TFG5_CALOO|nr:GAF domain-containing protein [Caldicellulosiruptor obsidiansis]ADL42935.1 GAF domain protein [Caldicellulosiruptor obsidiansis OB47]